MLTDEYGVTYSTTSELCELLYKNPELDITHVPVTDPDDFNNAVKMLWADYTPLKRYTKLSESMTDFDSRNQSNWFMPDEYKEMDIVKWVLDRCNNEVELQRVGEELLLYAERDLIDLLKYMKYLVDTLRKNNIVWGVGRGSSVSSFVLYIIGVHKINSIEYNLQIDEFLR